MHQTKKNTSTPKQKKHSPLPLQQKNNNNNNNKNNNNNNNNFSLPPHQTKKKQQTNNFSLPDQGPSPFQRSIVTFKGSTGSTAGAIKVSTCDRFPVGILRLWCFTLNSRTILKGNVLFWLVVSTHLKNISQNGNLPQVGVKIKNLWNHHLVFLHSLHFWGEIR